MLGARFLLFAIQTKCYDILPPGTGKHLVMDWVLGKAAGHEDDASAPCHAVAFGDRPKGNDAGLTARHSKGVPFVSVCELDAEVPDHVRSHHVGRNVEGAARVLAELVLQIETNGASTHIDVTAAVALAREKLLLEPCH